MPDTPGSRRNSRIVKVSLPPDLAARVQRVAEHEGSTGLETRQMISRSVTFERKTFAAGSLPPLIRRVSE